MKYIWLLNRTLFLTLIFAAIFFIFLPCNYGTIYLLLLWCKFYVLSGNFAKILLYLFFSYLFWFESTGISVPLKKLLHVFRFMGVATPGLEVSDTFFSVILIFEHDGGKIGVELFWNKLRCSNMYTFDFSVSGESFIKGIIIYFFFQKFYEDKSFIYRLISPHLHFSFRFFLEPSDI